MTFAVIDAPLQTAKRRTILGLLFPAVLMIRQLLHVLLFVLYVRCGVELLGAVFAVAWVVVSAYDLV